MATTTSSYEFTADTARIDPARVHALLREHTYWAADRPRETQDRAMANSRNYGMLHGDAGELVAYARVVTDLANFAWLADVVVDPSHRRRGLARRLVQGIVADLTPFGVQRVVLRASDEGRPLYEQLGWGPLPSQHEWLTLDPTA